MSDKEFWEQIVIARLASDAGYSLQQAVQTANELVAIREKRWPREDS